MQKRNVGCYSKNIVRFCNRTLMRFRVVRPGLLDLSPADASVRRDPRRKPAMLRIVCAFASENLCVFAWFFPDC